MHVIIFDLFSATHTLVQPPCMIGRLNQVQLVTHDADHASYERDPTRRNHRRANKAKSTSALCSFPIIPSSTPTPTIQIMSSTDTSHAQDDTGSITTTIKATTTVTLPAHPTPLTYEQLNPRSRATEFLGPWGTFGVTTIAPLWSYFIFFACNESTGCHPTSPESWKYAMSGFLGQWRTKAGQLWDWDAVWVYLAWYAFTVVCWAVLPGEQVDGTMMRNGKRKTYTMNGKCGCLRHTTSTLRKGGTVSIVETS